MLEVFKRAFDHHAVRHLRFADEARDLFDGAVFVVNIDADPLRPGPEQGLPQGWNPLSPGVETADGCEREIAHGSVAGGGAVDRAIVHQDEFPITGAANIYFHVVRAGGGRRFQSGDRIFRRHPLETSMGHDPHAVRGQRLESHGEEQKTGWTSHWDDSTAGGRWANYLGGAWGYFRRLAPFEEGGEVEDGEEGLAGLGG